jgi:Spy/CpxP family protein refolding chaperone
MSTEQYQLTHMQFELLSLWRGIEEQNLARIPDVEAKPDSTQGNEVVMVALPFSSFQLNPSLATYLSLTPSQVEAIQRVMMWEQHNLEPLMTQLRTTRERLLAIGNEHLNAKQVKALADTEASLLARLIVANARMQSKISKILSPEQQKVSVTPLSDGRTVGRATPQQRFLQLIRGGPLELLPPVDSMELLWSKPERAAVENRLRAAIVGSEATVRAGLEKLVRDTRADEVIVVTDTYEHSDRMDSYERVARIAAEIKLVPNVERRLK